MISSAQLKNTVTRFRVLENFLKTVTEVVLPFIYSNITNILMQWIAYLKTRPFCFAKCQSISALKLSFMNIEKNQLTILPKLPLPFFLQRKQSIQSAMFHHNKACIHLQKSRANRPGSILTIYNLSTS